MRQVTTAELKVYLLMLNEKQAIILEKGWLPFLARRLTWEMDCITRPKRLEFSRSIFKSSDLVTSSKVGVIARQFVIDEYKKTMHPEVFQLSFLFLFTLSLFF